MNENQSYGIYPKPIQVKVKRPPQKSTGPLEWAMNIASIFLRTKIHSSIYH